MPELPDVEGFRRYFARHARGKRVRGVEVPARDILRNTSPQRLARSLRGRRFGAPDRHGKWLLAPTGGPTLMMHFGMTGGLRWAGRNRGRHDRHRHDRVILRLDGGELRYRNMRKIGGLWLARDVAEIDRITGDLGPDADEVGRDEFEEMVSGRRGGLKATLMNQRFLAGIGNELSDEILWHARLDPTRRFSSLDDGERRALHREMQRVIRESNRHGRIPRKRSWISSQRGSRDPRCPRCRGPLRRSRIAGRTAYSCPRCQR